MPGPNFFDWGLAAAGLLNQRGAHLAIRATLPCHYERPGEAGEATPLECALLFAGGHGKTAALLEEAGRARNGIRGA